MKAKHRPERTCLGCGEKDFKDGLIRMVALPEGELGLDGRAPGRGGYLHKSEKCWEAFVRRKSLYRAFRREIGREAREKLVRALRDRYRE